MSDDTPESVLTHDQRDWLRGEAEYRPSVEADLRRRIRNRIKMSVFDYSLVLEADDDKFSVEDIDAALTEPEPDETGALLPLAMSLPNAIGLLYLAGRRYDTEAERPQGWYFEQRVEQGIQNALAKVGVAYEEVDVDITIEHGRDLETLAEEEPLSDLPEEQLRQMLFVDLISDREFADAIRERHGDD